MVNNANIENLNMTFEEAPGGKGCLIITLNGSIDTYNAHDFHLQVQQAVQKGFIRLIFNCRGLTRLSSTGIGSFAAFLKAAKSGGGDIILLEVAPEVRDVFHLLGFSQFFTMKSALQEALDCFRAPETFPAALSCPSCSQGLQAEAPGRYRCSECKAVLSVSGNGEVSLG